MGFSWHWQKLLEDANLTHLIGLAKVAAGNTFPKAQMMECRLERGKCDDEISKSVTVRQLPEDENQQVVPAGKTFDIFITLVFLNEPLEVVNGKKIA